MPAGQHQNAAPWASLRDQSVSTGNSRSTSSVLARLLCAVNSNALPVSRNPETSGSSNQLGKQRSPVRLRST